MMDLYDWQTWPNFYPVNFIAVEERDMAVVFEDPALKIYASPVDHLIPTIGLRFEFGRAGSVVAYSCDTEPSQIVRRLAEGAQVLIHEATGSSNGHTSPEKAGEIAAQAGVQSLYLIHYPAQLVEPETLLAQARQAFRGQVTVAKDFMEIEIENE
jgi:ribonuclease Z